MLLKENINQRIFIKRKLKIIGEILRSFHFDLRFGHFCSLCLIESAMRFEKWRWINSFNLEMLDRSVPFDNTVEVFLLESGWLNSCDFDPNANKFSKWTRFDWFLDKDDLIALHNSTGAKRAILIYVLKGMHDIDWIQRKVWIVTNDTS